MASSVLYDQGDSIGTNRTPIRATKIAIDKLINKFVLDIKRLLFAGGTFSILKSLISKGLSVLHRCENRYIHEENRKSLKPIQ